MNMKITFNNPLRIALVFSACVLPVATACGEDEGSSGTPDPIGQAGKDDSKDPPVKTGGTGGGGQPGVAGSTPQAGRDAVGGDGTAGDTGGALPGIGGETSEGGETGGGGAPPTGDDLPFIVNASPTGHDRFYAAAYAADGSIYALGQITSSNDTTADAAVLLAKFTSTGQLDKSFGANGYYVRNVVSGTSGELFRNIVVQSTGKLVAVGTIEHAGATDVRDRDVALIRVNADGTKDTSFGVDGIVKLDLSTGVANGTAFVADSAWSLAAYADDRLVVSAGMLREGGTDTDFALVRLSADGVPDEGFGKHGVFELDTAIEGNEHNNASARSVTILPGKEGLIGAGYQPKAGGGTLPAVYKVTDTGELDKSFGDAGVFAEPVLEWQTESYEVAMQPMAGGGYRLVSTGYGKQLEADSTDLVSLRLTSDGELDKSYGKDGLVKLDIAGFGDNSRRLLVLPDRRIALFGGGRPTSSNVDAAVVVLEENGAPDLSFAPKGVKLFDLGGPADFFWGGALSPDHKTLAITGIRGVGNAPMPASAADDAALLLLKAP